MSTEDAVQHVILRYWWINVTPEGHIAGGRIYDDEPEARGQLGPGQATVRVRLGERPLRKYVKRVVVPAQEPKPVL